MTETISAPDTQAAGSPRLPRPRTDGAAPRAIEDATEHVHERGQAHIQDCVDEILAKISGAAAAS